MKKILFYSDCIHLGGHELQVLNILPKLKQNYAVIFLVYKGNKHFIDLLIDLNIEIIKIDYYSNRFQFLRTFFSFKHISYLIKKIKEVNPSFVINIQGNIEFGSSMILAAKFANYKSITYIPITHYLSVVTNKGLIAKFKDLVNLIYFRLVDEYITINNFNRVLLLSRGVKTKVHVVLNGIDFTRYCVLNKLEARREIGLSSNKKYIALIGRVQFWHKGHDILIRMADKYRNELSSFTFVIVGTGEDLGKLKLSISDLKLDDLFIILGHKKNLQAVYSAIDGVVIPSRFESGAGTPMVLLESLFYKLPIVMSKLPEVSDYLDESCLFEIDNIDELFHKLIGLPSNSLRIKHITSLHSIEDMQDDFLKALIE